MDDLQLITKALMALDDKLVTCMRCGLCQAVCPVFGETLMEGDVTRGKLALLENLAHGLIEDADGVNDKLSRCLLCGSCERNCPSHVKILDIFLEARRVIATFKGLSPAKKLLFRTLLPNPRVLNTLLRVAGPMQELCTHADGSPQGTVCAPMLSPLLGERRLTPLAPVPLHAKVGPLNSPVGKSRLKVAFFPGCLGDKVFVNMAEACLKVFDHHEVGVYFPPDFTCCGIPALASGDRTGFEKQVMHNVDVFKRGTFDYIVTPCSSCTSTLRERWFALSERLPSRYRDAINELSLKAVDIHSFLVDVLKVRPRNLGRGVANKTRLTYHESCHLKALGVSEQARRLLRMNTDYELVDLHEADHCCGCGGTFTLQHYDLSRRIGDRKRANILASGADVVATGCPACMMQLIDTFAHHGDAINVRHSIEVYAEFLNQ